MDPPSQRSRLDVGWLPRARGDGPDPSDCRHRRTSASPRTRGWTPAVPDARPTEGGFPAHAGMDPIRTGMSTSPTRLPRARGDGPLCFKLCYVHAQASPRTRGWTPLRKRRARSARGFPAHAGMDPTLPGKRRPLPWLPRARGDGPELTAIYLLEAGASPRTRGWTILVARRRPRARGFPAHAGMDPGLKFRANVYVGLPRARGDGPATARSPHPRQKASPRTRGWTRAPGVPTTEIIRLPRARGDGPPSAAAEVCILSASPRTRGWTPTSRYVAACGHGFPAHAGMDPLLPTSAFGPRGLPRARGDGPFSTTL